MGGGWQSGVTPDCAAESSRVSRPFESAADGGRMNARNESAGGEFCTGGGQAEWPPEPDGSAIEGPACNPIESRAAAVPEGSRVQVGRRTIKVFRARQAAPALPTAGAAGEPTLTQDHTDAPPPPEEDDLSSSLPKHPLVSTPGADGARGDPAAPVLSAAVPVPAIAEQGEKRLRRLVRCSTAAARARIPYEQALRLCALPLGVFEHGGQTMLTVLTPGAADPAALRALTFLSGCAVEASYGARAEVEAALVLAYLGDAERLERIVGAANRELAASAPARHAGSSHPLVSAAPGADAPVPSLLEGIVHRALYLGASDIHLESTEAGMRIRFRVDGRLQLDTAVVIEPPVAANLVRRIKVLSKLEFSADTMHVEGAFTLEVGSDAVRLRVSVLGQSLGPKIVLRIIRRGVREQFVSSAGESLFCALGLTGQDERLLKRHLEARTGMVLVTGPTGSGKSTLLYAALEYLNEEWRNLITLEDPVERILSGVNQIQVPRAQYGEMLPLLLRQDPDVVMIGEIRDSQTADAALTAGITGQVVLSTVHAGSSLEALARLRGLGADPQLILASVSLIIAQRLLPRNCERCREPVPPREESDNERSAPATRRFVTWRGRGCADCGGSGIRGRCGVFELLPMTDVLRSYFGGEPVNGASFDSRLAASGYSPMSASIARRLHAGDISIETLNAAGALGGRR